MLDSVIKFNKKYYPQTLSEECKYDMKDNEMESLILINLVINLLMKLKLYFNSNKSLIVYVDHALLAFYPCQSYLLQHR